MSRHCPVCSFQQDSASDSGKCLGCGYQLDPSPDHETPWPHRRVRKDESPLVPDDLPDEREGLRAIQRHDYEYGRGIGGEHYGYRQTRLQTTFKIGSPYHERLVDETPPQVCPECGCHTGRESYRHSVYGAGYHTAECVSCGYELHAEEWCP